MSATLDEAREEAVDLGVLNETTGFLLRLAQLCAFELFFAALGDLDVRPGEISALIVIERNPGVRQGVLAQSLSIKRAHMTKMAKAFEAAGLVARHVPDDDRRAIELTLTDKGRRMVHDNAAAFAEVNRRTNARLAPDEAASLIRLLRKFISAPGDRGERDER